MFGYGAFPTEVVLDMLGEVGRGLGFAVDNEEVFGWLFEGREPAGEFLFVTMGGEAVDLGDAGFDPADLAQDADFLFATGQ